jgi:hypothetical protein
MSIFEPMNKLLSILLLLPLNLFSQSSPKNDVYDAKGITEHILHGDLYVFCSDSVKFVRERKPNCYVISYITPTLVHRKTEKIFKSGKPVFAGAMDDGSIFTIEVYDKNNPKKIINFITFHVNMEKKKIEEVEILK